jgi:hypothetical protein
MHCTSERNKEVDLILGSEMRKIVNVNVSQSSKCKRTRQMFTLIETMDLGSWFHLISLSNNGGYHITI